jgi:hypothetical protein
LALSVFLDKEKGNFRKGIIMGLFDFFKGKNKPTSSSEPVSNEETDQITVKYEAKVTAHELKADEATINAVVAKMVEEDPFKNYYSGKTLEDMTALSKRVYKYESITTVNVDFDVKEKDRILVVVEGTPIGFVPEEKAKAIQDYQTKHLLTAFVYVTGGPYLEYDREAEQAVEGESPLGLDIFAQFT